MTEIADREMLLSLRDYVDSEITLIGKRQNRLHLWNLLGMFDKKIEELERSRSQLLKIFVNIY